MLIAQRVFNHPRLGKILIFSGERGGWDCLVGKRRLVQVDILATKESGDEKKDAMYSHTSTSKCGRERAGRTDRRAVNNVGRGTKKREAFLSSWLWVEERHWLSVWGGGLE